MTAESVLVAYNFALPIVVMIALLAWAMGKRPGLFRSVAGVFGAVLAYRFYEVITGDIAKPWAGLVIDVAAMVFVTLPPRRLGQALIAGLFFAQVIMDVMAVVLANQNVAYIHWQGLMAVGIAKLVVLLCWSGGENGKAFVLRPLRAARRMALAKVGWVHAK